MSDPVFFSPSRRLTVGDIAALTGAELSDPHRHDVLIERLDALERGRPGGLVFAEGRRNATVLAGSRASAVLCTQETAAAAPDGMVVLVTARPQRAFAAVGRLLFAAGERPEPLTGEAGVSAAAHVDPSAVIEDGVVIEAGAVIGPHVGIGAGTIIGPNAVVGRSSQIGRGCYVGPGAVVSYALLGNRVIVHGGVRIGQDGFGFVPGGAGLEKMPQLGRVIVQDDVEIGANTTIDRGALDDTVIGEGTKIDNLVQIAHNVRIGRSTVIAGQCGISGSVTIGDGVMMGGGVGLADHLTIGSGAQIAAGSGLMMDVPAGERWGGYPAQPIKDAMREVATLRALVRRERERKEGKDG